MPTMVFKSFDDIVERIIKSFIKSESLQLAFHQFIKFAIIGVANTAIDFGIYYLLTRYVGFFNVATPKKYLANVISFLIATTFSFYANRGWTFGRKEKPTFIETYKFYSTTVSSSILNTALFYVLIRYLGMFDLYAKIFSTIISIVWNFFFKKFWVFTDKTLRKQVAILEADL